MSFNRKTAGVLVCSFGIVLLLAGCMGAGGESKVDSPNIEGKLLHAPENFTGESTGNIDGNGSITLLSDRGTRCDGPYRQVLDDNAAEVSPDESHNGVATLTCNDGRTGSVMFTVGADQAVGTGMLGEDIVTLRITE